MKNALKHNLVFVYLFIIWTIFGALFLLAIEKGDLVLWFNEHRYPLSDFYFIVASKLAEYGFIIFFLLVLLNISFGKAFIAAITWLFTGIAAQSLKRVFDLPRPAGFFDESILNFIGETKLHYAHSFPSGHTTTAFALFFLFALFTKNIKWQFLFFFLALSVAFSRVYLLQHFFVDVYFGSILGIIIAVLVFVSVNSSNIFGFQKWKNKNIGKKNLF